MEAKIILNRFIYQNVIEVKKPFQMALVFILYVFNVIEVDFQVKGSLSKSRNINAHIVRVYSKCFEITI